MFTALHGNLLSRSLNRSETGFWRVPVPGQQGRNAAIDPRRRRSLFPIDRFNRYLRPVAGYMLTCNGSVIVKTQPSPGMSRTPSVPKSASTL